MPPEQFREAARKVAEWAADYRESVADYPVLADVEPGEVRSRIADRPPPESAGFDEILGDVDRLLLPGITHWNHPGFLGYFSSSSSAPGMLAEFVIAALGVNAMLWRTSPAATELEERTVDWLRQWVGLPAAFRGVILDTASTSSFTALLAAREAAGLEVRERGMAGRDDLAPPAVYVSDQAHSSLEKAAIAAGIGRRRVRRIPTDGRYRMEPDALGRAMEEDREEGLRPTFVCATVGTTSTTSADPVDAIAEVCRREDAWLHVDAAYAGPAASLPEMREHFAGWERADSVVINPHKWMFTPLDCSVLLYRDPEAVRASLALTPEYLQGEEEGVTDLMDYGLPLGRRFRSLKLWFVFRWFGTDGLRRQLRRHVALAREFGDWVRADERFELAAPVPFSTVCFRARLPARREGDGPGPDRPQETGGEDRRNEWNRRLLAAVNREGSVFLSHTVLEGAYALRLAVGSIHTRREDVRRARDRLVEAYGRMAESGAAG